MSDHVDVPIRALVKGSALATIEYVCDLLRGKDRRDIWENRDQLADEIAEITMQCADESPESEVHAVRALAGGAS